ncbi:MAG: hypothetical protein M1818_008095 [Claussenomyces sp. TS43310]|nr:MAG: hypothetical protein M1818_008095 [Claussenomyces sp. TS43310]
MRGKRAKQYRKLMQQYALSFGFREPYQVLVDADILRDADRFKMDLVGGLERTLQGQVKPMITQCSMRHLYASAKEPGVSFLIDKAKLFERRRCNHLPEDYPEPLSTAECLSSVVDPKDSNTNKHRYVVASQDLPTRKALRQVKGVPLVYINRSVMIMEPMALTSAEVRNREERGKFRDGLRRGAGPLSQGAKRKREDDDGNVGEQASSESLAKKKKKSEKGSKGPNPLSVKKPKGKTDAGTVKQLSKDEKHDVEQRSSKTRDAEEEVLSDGAVKKKRKRRHKSGTGIDETVNEAGQDRPSR